MLALVLCTACGTQPQQPTNATASEKITFQVPAISESAKNFYVVNDLGRNGYYQQKPIAELLGELATEVDIEFVVAAGDTHHFDGVGSVSDPLWVSNYENIYTHPELMLDWFAVCGNHEYRGNTQAVVDYTAISRRWNMPSRYYSRTVEAGENETALLLFIDTTPLIDKYRTDSETYPDAVKQDMEAQLKWMDETLKQSNAKWKLVMGHHPVYAETKKGISERTDMQSRVQPILDRNNVDAYICGHIHNFQHIRVPGSKVDYVVNSSGSLSRKVKEVEGTVFCSPEAGFSIVSMEDNKLTYFMMNGEGQVVYQFNREK
ncbi:MAG: metallophosphoesterase [Bacteroidales bacterium]